jgi:hypothetical protein
MFDALFVLAALLAPPEIGLRHEADIVRLAKRVQGAVLIQSAHPGMSRKQVIRLLGDPDTIFVSCGMTQWCYCGSGIQLFGYRPVWVFVPARALSPRAMGVL